MATSGTDKQKLKIPSRNTRRIRRRFIVGILILCVVLFISSDWINVRQLFAHLDNDASGVNDTGKRIQVSVLNASSVQGSAMKMTEHLRSLGYDVVEIGNYDKNNVDSSFVIVWANDTVAAKKITKAAGIFKTKFISKRNSKTLVDFSVILGDDCQQFNPPRERGGIHL